MQSQKAAYLRQIKTPCLGGKHRWEKEYMAGMQTGDYVCSVCGIEISGPDYEKLCKKQAEGK